MNPTPLLLALLALAGLTLPLAAKHLYQDADALIEEAALDYVDGFYSGEPARLESGLHPSLQKVVVERAPWGGEVLKKMDRHTLIEYTKIYGGKTPVEARKIEVTNLAVSGNIATVAIDSSGFLDYAHVAKINDEWRIINVLWTPHGPQPPAEITDEDRAAIEKAGMDYVDGFYAGSGERIESALHPRLQKVVVRKLPNGREIFQYSLTDDLVGYTASGQGKKPAEERKVKVKIHAAHGNIATIEIDSVDFLDYAHVARIEGKWKIVNVLWRPHEKK